MRPFYTEPLSTFQSKKYPIASIEQPAADDKNENADARNVRKAEEICTRKEDSWSIHPMGSEDKRF